MTCPDSDYQILHNVMNLDWQEGINALGLSRRMAVDSASLILDIVIAEVYTMTYPQTPYRAIGSAVLKLRLTANTWPIVSRPTVGKTEPE